MIRAFFAGFIYFAIVFASGFSLGLIRVPILVPRFGERIAELIESPFMFVAIVLTSRWLVKRLGMTGEYVRPLLAGIFAAVLMLTVEFGVVLCIRGISFSEILMQRDTVAAAVYYSLVAFFAAAPLIFSAVSHRNYDR